ncbi:MAG TPA: hypothetical protein VF520_15510 [Thermoleophilaceae bacterium]|jgi:hypothetical protein
MPIVPDKQATLTQGRFTTLHTTIFRPCKVTLTGVSGEFTTIPFRIKRRGFEGEPFEASEASIPRGGGLAVKRIQATTPEGVGTLDIVYELRTGVDAG